MQAGVVAFTLYKQELLPFDRRPQSMDIRCSISIYLLTHHKMSRESFDLCVQQPMHST